METDLVSLTVHMTGWFDTGRTNLTMSVRRCHYNSDELPGRSVTLGEELFGIEAEVFLDETASEVITAKLMKALSCYETAMCLP